MNKLLLHINPIKLVNIPISTIKKLAHSHPRKFLKDLFLQTWQISGFGIVLIIFLIDRSVSWLASKHIIPSPIAKKFGPSASRMVHKLYDFNRSKESTISRENLINLAIKNMKFKPARSFITIGGMSVGIGVIVFLVSIGYGLERMVINRVARLEELKQIDVSPQIGSQVSITDKTLSSFTDIPDVEQSLPLISVVGRVNYNNSITDVAVFGVTTAFLEHSAIQPVKGKVYDNNDIAISLPPEQGSVAGTEVIRATYGEKIRDVEISFEEGQWSAVRSGPSVASPLLGFTKRAEGITDGAEYWGSSYPGSETGKLAKSEDDEWLGLWVKGEFLLFDREDCDSELDQNCYENSYVVKEAEDGQQIQSTGFVAELGMSIKQVEFKKQKVLGIQVLAEESTISAESEEASESANELEVLNVVTDEQGNEYVELASESGNLSQVTQQVSLSNNAMRQAVVNRSFLQVVGINEENAIDTEFEVSFVVLGELLQADEGKLESAPEKYKIVAVVPDEDAPFFYVPFVDLRGLGIVNYSQIKVIVEDNKEVAKVRQQVEAMGYNTTSVVDTVAQIDRLFGTVRLVLGAVGMVALSVAGLGMFNTMSVSLLERTREVGLMKAMGMRSHEVKELFLTESMTMGFFGGLLGIILGVAAGKLVSLVLSIFSVFKGVGFIDISYLPLPFVIFILTLSVLVGMVTGLYPARRATKISALDALRYE